MPKNIVDQSSEIDKNIPAAEKVAHVERSAFIKDCPPRYPQESSGAHAVYQAAFEWAMWDKTKHIRRLREPVDPKKVLREELAKAHAWAARQKSGARPATFPGASCSKADRASG